jgi:hypothetical protein
MGDSRAILRLGGAPILLLAWSHWSGDILPYLGAMLAVTLLAPGGRRPPMKLLLAAPVLITGITWTLVIMFRMVADSPGSVWMALLALATLCFARLARKPDDVPALLALLTSVVVTALIRSDPSLSTQLPWAMAIAAIEAVVTVLLAHAVLPSAPIPSAPKPARAPPAMPGLRAFLKALAMVVALGVSVAAQEPSGVLVAITLSNLLRDPEDTVARRFGRELVFGNLGAAMLVLPLILMANWRPQYMFLLPLALAAGLWLASGQGRPGWRGVLAQAGLPVFVLLLSQLLPIANDGALAALGNRLFFLTIAVTYGLSVLVLLRPTSAWGVTAPARAG